MKVSQPDLFADQQTGPQRVFTFGLEQPPPADFIERIREELDATLRMVREAELLPWPDLTRTTMAELRFHSICEWLPAPEATLLRASFEEEMSRLYTEEDKRFAAAQTNLEIEP